MSRNAANELKSAVKQLQPELVRLRRDFHMRPELAFEEHETARAIAEYLRGIGLEVTEGVGKTGVVGLLRGEWEGDSDRTLLIRADIDALPVTELNETDYRSRNPGVMHACGHDGHIAVALGVARLLADRHDRLRGHVKFAFQPAEERVGGAGPMIADGVLRDPAVTAAIGLHLWSSYHVGEIVVQAGPFFASADEIHLTVRGRGGHGAMPHVTVDPIAVSAEIIVAMQTLVSREIAPLHAAVVTFGHINGGTTGNVIADEVRLIGTVRAYEEADRAYLHRRIREVAQGIASTLRAEADVTIGPGIQACVNDPEITALMRRAAEATVGADHIPPGDQRQSVSDDMALFLDAVPGCYIMVGAGNPERGIDAPHHSARFDMDEACLGIGAEVLTRAALDYLA